MKLRITHEPRYDYASPVQLAHPMSCLHPVDTPRQRVLARHDIDTEAAKLARLFQTGKAA